MCFQRSSKKHAVSTVVLTPAAACTHRSRAGANDAVTVNYKGTLTADGTAFDDTFKIGRPLEFTLGAGGLIAGWETGIPGMCVGETRRLFVPPQFGYGAAGQAGKIPPDAHLTFDVELLAVNGKDVTALRAEDAAAAAAAAAAAGDATGHAGDGAAGGAAEAAASPSIGGSSGDDVLAHRLGQRESPYCDACSTVLEEFYGSWVTTMMRQVGAAEVRGGGSAPPAVTYNDDTEAMVQGFCSNRTVSQIASSPPVYAPHVRLACERIMSLKKRELVGQFLSAELDGRILPGKNALVCGEWLGACPRQARGKNGEGRCGVCRTLLEDLAFEARRAVPPPPSASREGARSRLSRHLDHVCQNMYYRRPLKRDDVDTCEDLVDDHREQILDTRLGTATGGGGGGGGGGSWLEVAREVCVHEAGACAAGKVTEANFIQDEL